MGVEEVLVTTGPPLAQAPTGEVAHRAGRRFASRGYRVVDATS